MFKALQIRVFIQKNQGQRWTKCLMINAVYVDDIVLASNDIEMLNAEKAKLNEQFDMKDLGEIH